MSTKKSYDMKNVNLLITTSASQFYVTGFSSGSSITAEKSKDKYTIHTGIKGDSSYAKNNDNSGTIKFKIKIDSQSNGPLYALAQSDETFNAAIIDANDSSKSKVNAADCVIQKPANYERSAELKDGEWTIGCPSMDIQYD